MKQLLIIWLCSISLSYAQKVEFDIYFNSGKFALTTKNTSKLNKELSALDSTAKYNFIIKGYTDFVDTENFNLKLSQDRATSVSSYLEKNYKENIYVVPVNKLKVGKSYAFGKINFKIGRVTLLTSSKKELEKLVRFLRKNRNIHIEIQGHVCCGGLDVSDALNSDTGTQTLSVDRARFIYRYLMSRGISEKRLSYKGYAFKSPLRFPEKGRRDRSANRRVEIMITKV